MAQKKGSIAIPFLLTFLISLIIIGGGALYVYNNIMNNKGDTTTASEVSADEYVPAEDMRCTTLFILDLDDPGMSVDVTMMLVRAIPDRQHFVCVPIATNMVATVGEKKATVGEFYQSGGAISAREAIATTLGVPIDRYMKMNDNAFQKICSIFGGVNYTISAGMQGFSEGQQYLTSEQIQKLLTYPFYEAGEEQRMSSASSLITAMINQSSGSRIAETLDSTFNTLVNITETDMTAIDFSKYQKAIKYIFTSTKEPAQFRNPTGDWTTARFAVGDEFTESLQVWFGYKSDDQSIVYDDESTAQ